MVLASHVVAVVMLGRPVGTAGLLAMGVARRVTLSQRVGQKTLSPGEPSVLQLALPPEVQPECEC